MRRSSKNDIDAVFRKRRATNDFTEQKLFVIEVYIS
jgi:hypothetical protein